MYINILALPEARNQQNSQTLLLESNPHRHIMVRRISTNNRNAEKRFRLLLTFHQLEVKPPQRSSDKCQPLVSSEMSSGTKRHSTTEGFQRLVGWAWRTIGFGVSLFKISEETIRYKFIDSISI